MNIAVVYFLSVRVLGVEKNADKANGDCPGTGKDFRRIISIRL
jgi:hypothetical protein